VFEAITEPPGHTAPPEAPPESARGPDRRAKKNKLTSADIEMALTSYQGSPFKPRRYVVVPNVSWGWNLRYEADVIAVSPSGWCTEVEIKVSRSDLLVDAKKRKWEPRGLDARIRRFFYAVPEALRAAVEAWPRRPAVAGLIVVGDDGVGRVVKAATTIKTARPATDEEILCLHRLASIRYWDLRAANQRLWDELKELKKIAEVKRT